MYDTSIFYYCYSWFEHWNPVHDYCKGCVHLYQKVIELIARVMYLFILFSILLNGKKHEWVYRIDIDATEKL